MIMSNVKYMSDLYPMSMSTSTDLDEEYGGGDGEDGKDEEYGGWRW